jgi:hypothetical protein
MYDLYVDCIYSYYLSDEIQATGKFQELEVAQKSSGFWWGFQYIFCASHMT